MQASKGRRRAILAAACAAVVACAPMSSVFAASDLYWDSDGTATGGSANTVATGTWGTNAFWNDSVTGGAGTLTATTSSANDVHFAASTDVTGTYTVTINAAQS